MQFELTNFCEIDKFAIQSYCAMHNEPSNKNLGDISNVDTSQVKDFDLLIGGSPCFVAGTKVFTENGFRNIEEIQIGEKVLTHKNRYMSVVRTGGRKEQKIYQLNVDGFLPIECTIEHPFYCKKTKDTAPEKIRLKNIKSGYYVGTHIVDNDTISNLLMHTTIQNTTNLFEYYIEKKTTVPVENKEELLQLSLICQKLYNISCGMYEKDGMYYLTFSKNENYFIEDGIVWHPVKEITDTCRTEDVYNIEVEEDHTYTANNIITYNCTDFSLAGKKEGAIYTCNHCGHRYNPLEVHYSKRKYCPHCGSDDIEITRSSLIVEYLRFLREKQPKFAVYENVKNLVNKEFKPVFDLFIEEIKEIGYVPYWEVMNAKYYGIPQNRERIIGVFIRKDIDHGFTYPERVNLLTSINDITEDNVPENYYIAEDKSDPFVKELIERGKLSENFVYLNNQLFNLGLLDMKGLEQSRRVYAKYGCSPTLTTNSCSVNILDTSQYLFNINPSHRGMSGCIYNSNGISPTLTTQDGMKFLFPVVSEFRTDTHYKLFKGNVCGTLRTIVSGGDKRLIEPKDLPICVASRGRSIVDPNSRVVGQQTKQRLEPNENGTTNTLTTVAKDNYILENAIQQYSKATNIEDTSLRTFVPTFFNNYLLEPFIFFHKFVSNGIQTCYNKHQSLPKFINLRRGDTFINGENEDCLMIIKDELKEELEKVCKTSGYRVRKLTPRECFRLMGFSDEVYDKARYYTEEEEEELEKNGRKYKTEKDEFGNECAIKLSNAQAYKQAGNSIVVNVLYYLFKSLREQYSEFSDGIKLCSLFSGIGAPEQALKALDNEEILVDIKSEH